tara:strand:- start:119 stop:856 length:738 start_codon:yes stop_codon:yes gene_type:complete
MSPKFSIILPAYNASEFIVESLESAISQTYDNLEIIAVDNESTDDTLSKLKLIKAKHPELKVLTAKNLYKHSWEEPVFAAIKEMSGEFFTILGADDIIHPNYVKSCVDVMLSKKCEAMQSPLLMFEKRDGSTIPIHNSLTHSYNGLEDFKDKLTKWCCVTTPSVVYKSSVVTDYDFSMNSSQYLGSGDYYLYCSLADQGLYIDISTDFLGYFYRTHANQNSTGMHSSNGFQIDESIRSKFREKWK